MTSVSGTDEAPFCHALRRGSCCDADSSENLCMSAAIVRIVAREVLMSPDACAFCRPRPADVFLFETASLRVMPDESPLVPGHVLIVPKAHLRCYGAGSPEIWA